MKRWVYRHRDNNNLNRQPQPGQKCKLDATKRNAVIKTVQENPFTNAAIVGRKHGVNKNTVRKIWKDAGIYQAQKEARVGYALENLTRDWSKVIVSDEKTYQTDRHQRMHVYHPKNSRFED